MKDPSSPIKKKKSLPPEHNISLSLGMSYIEDSLSPPPPEPDKLFHMNMEENNNEEQEKEKYQNNAMKKQQQSPVKTNSPVKGSSTLQTP